MIKIREDIYESDLLQIREMIKSTGLFDAVPDEIDYGVKLAKRALLNGNNEDNYKVIFAEEDGEVVGYSCFAHVPCSSTSFEIYWIIVHKNHHRKGVGNILIREVERRARKYGAFKICLQTAGREDYYPTHAFYQKMGFIPEARIKDHFQVGDDLIIFTKDLRP